MLTGPTSKRVPFNRPRSTNKTSRRFDFPNSSITASESSVMIEIRKKNLEGVEGCGAEGEGSGQGYFPPQSDKSETSRSSGVWMITIVEGLCAGG